MPGRQSYLGSWKCEGRGWLKNITESVESPEGHGKLTLFAWGHLPSKSQLDTENPGCKGSMFHGS